MSRLYFVIIRGLFLMSSLRGLTQQSKAPRPQLSFPHTKSPAQSSSLSQSPFPRPHGLLGVQQCQSIFAGLHLTDASKQQSSPGWAPSPQLLFPHTNCPRHSLSLSQSPLSLKQGFDSVQQPQLKSVGLSVGQHLTKSKVVT